MTTDITELTQEAARESGSILIIVAARMARREFFTPLHALCEAGKRVVSTRALHDAVERAEERMVSQVPKIVDGHDRLTKKLKEAESRNAELVEAQEKAQQTEKTLEIRNRRLDGIITAAEQRIAELESRTVTVENLQESAWNNSLITTLSAKFHGMSGSNWHKSRCPQWTASRWHGHGTIVSNGMLQTMNAAQNLLQKMVMWLYCRSIATRSRRR
ncbi:hypothetical protein WDU56_21590 [Klebsiella pneumoniae]